MSRLVLVTGGCRSGKSDFAAALADQLAVSPLLLATCIAADEEMRERVAAHRARRPSHWQTAEEPFDPPAAIERLQTDAVVLDSIDLWLSNLLVRGDSPESMETALMRLIEATAAAPMRFIIVVSSEVGLGVVPPTALGRQFRDLIGTANQRLAAQASHVFVVTAGLANEVKTNARSPEGAAKEVSL